MRIRKFSPADRQYPIFEMWDDDADTIFFDVSVSDAGFLEIAFHSGISNQVLLADDFESALAEAKQLALAALNSD